MNKFLPSILLLLSALCVCAGAAAEEAPSFNTGFDLEGGLISSDDIDQGGPGRDGIPALDNPRFLSGGARDSQIKPGDRVMGVSYNGVAKAYPIAILDQHEIVNDKFGDTALTVTFCPLCGTGMVFLAKADGKLLKFGVSGLIYNSDMLLYDRNTQSLWSQIMKTAVTGPLKGTILTQVPAQYITWSAWLQQHPKSLLLSRDTGHQRNYDEDPYAEYKQLPIIWFPTLHADWRVPDKSWVAGITVGDEALALPFKELDKLKSALAVTVGGQLLEVQWDKAAQTARAFDTNGKEFPITSGYWFAWVTFHPDTALYLAEPAQ